MKEFKGTKGKWVARKYDNMNQFYIEEEDFTKKGICMLYNKEGEEEHNSKLIAAAPYLLEALQKWCIGFEFDMENKPDRLDKIDYEMYDEAKQAINKALGL